jgi:hypothetical protein
MPVRYAINAGLFILFLGVVHILIGEKIISNYYAKIIMLIALTSSSSCR